MMIHCIGDSHVCVFSGQPKIVDGLPSPLDILPGFRTYRLGPHLAYSVGDRNHSNYHTAIGLIKRLPITESTILISYGEIDCRAHILYQSEKQGREIYSIVDEVISRYEVFISDVYKMGYKVIVWCPIATCNYDSDVMKDPTSFPHYGSTIVRNGITKQFGDTLFERFKGHTNIKVLSLLDKLLNDDMTSKMEYYMDGVHLSQKAMPFILEALEGNI